MDDFLSGTLKYSVDNLKKNRDRWEKNMIKYKKEEKEVIERQKMELNEIEEIENWQRKYQITVLTDKLNLNKIIIQRKVHFLKIIKFFRN